MRSETDAIVVLGCRVAPSGRLTPAAAGRAAAAASAYREGRAPLIVASGGRRWGAHVEAIALKEAMIDRGVPEAAIVTELWSFTTCENAVFSTALLRGRGARSALVVTCEWHLPRALMSFRAAGLEAEACPRPSTPGLYDRCAEALRRAYDARAMKSTGLLAGSAETFLGGAQGEIAAASAASSAPSTSSARVAARPSIR